MATTNPAPQTPTNLTRESDLESRLGEAHRRIGALDMTNHLTDARNAFLESEVTRLRTAILANLSVLENATGRDNLLVLIDGVIDGLGDALYPNRIPVDEPTCPMAMTCTVAA